MKRYCWALIALWFLVACQESREARITRLVSEWTDREIRFPEHSVFTVQGRDTVDFSPNATPYKVLVFVDSVGCMSCRLQLPRWKELIAYTDSVASQKVSYLFYLQTSDVKRLQWLLRRDAFSFPVCIETESEMQRLNRFPAEESFKTFLLGADNKVLAMGNPIHNPKVKDLYLSFISGKRTTETALPVTTVEPVRSVVDLGSFSWKEEKQDSVVLRNTGKAPLVIYDITTNCGCLQTAYSKEPVRPNDSTVIYVCYKADHIELVNKVLHVHGNLENNKPLTIRVKGQAR